MKLHSSLQVYLPHTKADLNRFDLVWMVSTSTVIPARLIDGMSLWREFVKNTVEGVCQECKKHIRTIALCIFGYSGPTPSNLL